MNWRDFIKERLRIIRDRDWFLLEKQHGLKRESRPRCKKNIFNKNAPGT